MSREVTFWNEIRGYDYQKDGYPLFLQNRPLRHDVRLWRFLAFLGWSVAAVNLLVGCL